MSAEKQTTSPTALPKISGHVLSSEGAMLKGARVKCGKKGTTTLADGSFNIADITPGTHQIKASLQGFKPKSKTVDVREGEETRVDFSLSAVTGKSKICGHVFDAETKKPVGHEGSVILILPVANKYRRLDSDGCYEFSGLPVGTYRVVTAVPDYEDSSVVLTVKRNGETKSHDFFCKALKTVEPPWG